MWAVECRKKSLFLRLFFCCCLFCVDQPQWSTWSWPGRKLFPTCLDYSNGKVMFFVSFSLSSGKPRIRDLNLIRSANSFGGFGSFRTKTNHWQKQLLWFWRLFVQSKFLISKSFGIKLKAYLINWRVACKSVLTLLKPYTLIQDKLNLGYVNLNFSLFVAKLSKSYRIACCNTITCTP